MNKSQIILLISDLQPDDPTITNGLQSWTKYELLQLIKDITFESIGFWKDGEGQ
tara:strand:- start:360 stop:521 length:162 start_codon:yes stop_codon:yes gene_type:complete